MIEARTKADLKAKFKRMVFVNVGGRDLAFKPLDRAKLIDLQKQVSKSPDLRVALSINAIGFCCVYGQEHFDEVANEYPLALVGSGDDGSPGVLDALMTLARGAATVTIEE